MGENAGEGDDLVFGDTGDDRRIAVGRDGRGGGVGGADVVTERLGNLHGNRGRGTYAGVVGDAGLAGAATREGCRQCQQEDDRCNGFHGFKDSRPSSCCLVL